MRLAGSGIFAAEKRGLFALHTDALSFISIDSSRHFGESSSQQNIRAQHTNTMLFCEAEKGVLSNGVYAVNLVRSCSGCAYRLSGHFGISLATTVVT